MNDLIYDYWLCSIPGVGNRSISKLLEVCGSAGEVYRADGEILRTVLKPGQVASLEKLREIWHPEEEWRKLQEKEIAFLTINEENYPLRLSRIPDAPYGIFYRGMLPEENIMSVAVIGARDCSEYGAFVARELGAYLGRHQIQVVSGMARGVDGISQMAALDAGGSSTAVLGSGVDVCYPPQNRKLYQMILEKGCVCSPYPPGTPARSGNFPPRNRIVSGLADAVVVVEARDKSGTLITVDMALEQGKEVYVVPGRITDRLSDSCNRLLKQGAGLFISPGDFLEEISELWQRRREPEKLKKQKPEGDREELLPPGLSEDLLQLWKLLDFSPQTAESLGEKWGGGYSVARVRAELMRLVVMGLAQQDMPGYFGRKG